MNKIKTAVRINIINTTASTIVRRYKEHESKIGDNVYLASLVGEIEAIETQMNVAINNNKYSSKSDVADSERDKVLRKFSKAIEGCCAMYSGIKQESAEHLRGIFKSYTPKIYREGYSSQSSLIKSLLKDFDTEKSRQAIEELPEIENMINDIKVVQANFERVSDEYTASKANKLSAASTYKAPLLELINIKFRTYLKAMYFENPSKYGAFYNEVVIAIDNANASVRATKKTTTETKNTDEVNETETKEFTIETEN